MSKRSLKVAAVHAAPVFMDKDATIQKVVRLIQEANSQDVNLLVFPEAFVPGYPGFIMTSAPWAYLKHLQTYIQQSVQLYDLQSPGDISSARPTEDIRIIMRACKTFGVSVVLGISERSTFSRETIFNSQVFISCHGHLLGVHRKLVPTYSERSIWAFGGGMTLRCWDMPLSTTDTSGYARIGGLLCGENLNLGASLSLIDEGEQIHAASWPDQCAFIGMEQSWEFIKLRAQAHSSSAFCFTIAASSIATNSELDWIKTHLGEQVIMKEGSGWSGIVAPTGQVLVEDCGGLEDRLLTAQIDLSDSLGKLVNDPAGHYRRPEVLKFTTCRDAIWRDDELMAGTDCKGSLGENASTS